MLAIEVPHGPEQFKSSRKEFVLVFYVVLVFHVVRSGVGMGEQAGAQTTFPGGQRPSAATLRGSGRSC